MQNQPISQIEQPETMEKPKVSSSASTMKLSNPIMIDGAEVLTLQYDFEKATEHDVSIANRMFRRLMGGAHVMQAMQTEPMFCFAFFCAVCAKTMKCDVTDIERICGRDIIRAEYVGKSFLMEIFAG